MVSASAMPAHRSSTAWSWSVTARMTVRMSNGFLRSGLAVAEKIVADRRELARRVLCGKARTSRSRGSVGLGRPRPSARPVRGRRGRSARTARRRRREVRCPVLRLAVRPHHPVVAADAEVVLGRHAARVVQGVLAGQHHRAVRRHHQDALGVHQHRGLGVPVRLGAHVDARDHDVDLAAGLGELDDPAQALRDPVHVLGAAVHRDLRARRQREPLDRQAALLGEVERGDDAGRTRARRRCPAPSSGRRTAPRGSCPRGSAAVGVVTRPTTMPAVFVPGARSTGASRPSASRSCSTNVPPGPATSGASSYG